MRAKQGRNTLLPLSTWEAYRFIRPGSLYLTRREMQGYSFAIINVFRNLLIVVFMVLVDYLVFWILDMVHHLLQGDIVARAPTTVFVAVNGSGLIREIYTSVVSAFDIIQGANLSVLSQKCLVLPAEPDFRGYLVLGAMYGLAFFITIFGVYVQRLNRTICASYHPSREQERICFLYNNLATKRLRIESALIKSVKMNAEDKGHTNILFILAAKLPAFQWLLRLLGSTEQYCMGCAVVVSGTSGLDYLPCVTTGCKGLYCKGCFELLNNVCAICMAPLAYSEAMDEEIDSSDEEAVHMYIEAMKSLRAKEKEKRRKMRVFLKDRLRQFIRSQGGDGVRSQMLLQKYRAKARKRESSSETSETETSEDSGETDYEYQDKSEDSDKSDTEAVSPSWKPKKNTNLVYTNE
uniref:Dendritic cell-specific transmembrane protein-like domain-containing protein n=1 Tax=Leptobrachium leishanense TaxID=445787 RepID=A0A8C5Q5L7_9ANUR